MVDRCLSSVFLYKNAILALFYHIENDFVYCSNATVTFIYFNDFTENKGSFK